MRLEASKLDASTMDARRRSVNAWTRTARAQGDGRKRHWMRAEWVNKMLSARRENASRMDTESMDAKRPTASNLDAASAATIAAAATEMHTGGDEDSEE